MANENILDILQKYKLVIDTSMSNIIPRQLNSESLISYLGKPTYDFDISTSDRAVNKPIWDLLDRGGKHWRPALTLMVAGALGCSIEKISPMAAAIELIHNGTLMADDIEDDSQLRRGLPCTHIKFGVDIAVNASSTMFFLSLNPFLKHNARFSNQVMIAAYDAYITEMIKLGYGQAMDIYWHKGGSDHVTEGQYLQMCAFKTGTLARLAAKWGAIFGGGTDAQIEVAGALAEGIGVAFQIQDDVLNLVGDESAYGKEIGGDITEGKRTLLVIYALEKASKEDRKKLLEILGEHTRDKEKLRQAILIIKESGAFERANKRAREIVEKAWAKFDKEFPPSKYKKELEMLANFVIDRSV